jgi:Spy/CpxP family protein refolding chaperone
MKKALMSVFAVMLAAGMATGADAMMHGKGKGMGMMSGGMDHGKHMMHKLTALGLDDKQMESVKAIHLKARKETVRKKADEEIAGIELKELLAKDPVDMKAADSKVRQIEALRGDIRMIHIREHEEIKGLLTPDQKKKFVPMAGMHGECMDMDECDMMGGGMGHGMMGGMGGKGGCGMMGDMDRGDRKEPGKKDETPAPAHMH